MAKKDFKSNPALAFISEDSIEAVDHEEEQATIPTGGKPPAGYKLNPKYLETKSKRVQILIQPSVHKKAKAVSKKLGISLNDFISRAVQEACYNELVLEQLKKDLKGE